MSESVSGDSTQKKRGRKPSKERKGYFYETQEQAVRDYLASDDEAEKNRIYNEILKPAFTKMVESIIRRYKLYPPDDDYENTFNDTISFLMTKLDHFDPLKKYKAYSYCGTICKNYLIYRINQCSKRVKRNVSYDNPLDISKETLADNINYSYSNVEGGTVAEQMTGRTVNEIKKMLENKENCGITDNEEKVGMALLDLIGNWENMFAQMGSDKFNKSSILLYIKETTNLSTTEIRNAMKRYRTNYYLSKEKILL